MWKVGKCPEEGKRREEQRRVLKALILQRQQAAGKVEEGNSPREGK